MTALDPFKRDMHGSLFDRGAADSFYGRPQCPHYGGVGGNSGPRIEVQDPEMVSEYEAGFKFNEESGAKKDWT